MRHLTMLAAATAMVLGLTCAGAASAGDWETNTLACPGPGAPTIYQEDRLQLDETRQIGNSGMYVRVTDIFNHYNGFMADFQLPGITPRLVTFSGHPKPTDTFHGPIVRFRACGKIYEISSGFNESAGIAIIIRILSDGF